MKVKEGEIHCLVGENGAGKSTLMKILSGVYPYGQYSGEILIEGHPVQFHSIRDSEKAGISIIYQELSLVPEMMVYENIFLSNEIRKGLVVDTEKEIDEAGRLLKMVKADYISPTAKVKNLSVSMQQLVEIAKALSSKPKALILRLFLGLLSRFFSPLEVSKEQDSSDYQVFEKQLELEEFELWTFLLLFQ